MNTKKQLNARVPVEMRAALKAVAGISGLTLERITEDAFRVYFGQEDDQIEINRQSCRNALRRIQKGNKLPFEQPLTPSENNVLTAAH